MTRNADFVIVDIETLGHRSDCVVLNFSILSATWIDIFGDYSGEYVRENIVNGVANEYLLSSYKEAVHKVRKRALSVALDIDEQVADGRTIDEGVVDFWGKHPEAYKKVTSGRTISYKQAYDLMFKYLERTGYQSARGQTEIFVRAPHFDVPKIEHLTGHKLPFSHYNVRDIRTICDMAFHKNDRCGYSKLKYKDGSDLMDNFGFVPHDSVDDIARDMLQVHMSYAVTNRI